jgi:hypothetical protein
LTCSKVGAEQLARLEVDLADRVLERRHRLGEVGALRVEEALALARLAELLERGEVDRAERFDLAVEGVDLPCSPASLTLPSSMLLADRLAIGAGRLELLEVLGAAELRRLLLELQRADLVAQRLQRLLVAEPRSSAARRRCDRSS